MKESRVCFDRDETKPVGKDFILNDGSIVVYEYFLYGHSGYLGIGKIGLQQ